MRYSICSINKARDDQLILFLPLFRGNQGKTWVLPVLPGMAPLYKSKTVKKLALDSQSLTVQILTNDVQVPILCLSYFITTVPNC